MAAIAAAMSHKEDIEQPFKKNKNRVYEIKNEVDSSKINLGKGLKEFTFGDNKLWALNQKNANEKAKNKGWI